MQSLIVKSAVRTKKKLNKQALRIKQKNNNKQAPARPGYLACFNHFE
jgi:hypothetical protein